MNGPDVVFEASLSSTRRFLFELDMVSFNPPATALLLLRATFDYRPDGEETKKQTSLCSCRRRFVSLHTLDEEMPRATKVLML